MKLGNRRPTLNTVTVVIPRSDDEPLVFICQAVIDETEFETLCPFPQPPTVVHADGTKTKDYDDEKYIKTRDSFANQKLHWTILQSLKATPDLQWETVDYGNPATWGNYTKELKDFNLTDPEIRLIIQGVLEVNTLDEMKLEEARAAFLAGRRAQAKAS